MCPRHEDDMLKKAAIAIATIIFVFVLLPALLFVAGVSVQEGCLICFEAEGRGGPFEAAVNLGIAVAFGWAGYKVFRRFVLP